MLFNSLEFLAFFPMVVLLYFIIPHRIRTFYLLLCSYYFYICWNAKYAILLFGSTGLTYITGLLIGRIPADETRRFKLILKKTFVVLGFTINLTILFFFKYANFLIENLNTIFENIKVQAAFSPLDIILPVGISFYIFQALGYTVDVYRGEVKAELDFIKYATFVSFFPQLIAGPIERSANLLDQFDEKHTFDHERVKNGILLMLWGYFQKVVIADRISVMVDAAYTYPYYYGGVELMVVTILFAFQVYCDFAGYTCIARGAGQVMGFKLMNNFESPYFASTVAGFWRRWHISLTSWFRDYLYFPLGGSRKGKCKHYRNILIVFLVSGIWHGASWNFVIWGGLNGLYQIVERILGKWIGRLGDRFGFKRNVFSSRLLQVLITFVLVDISWVFFRAGTVNDASVILIRMFTEWNPWVLFDGSLYDMGLSKPEFQIGILSILLLLLVDYLHYKGYHIREFIAGQQVWFRWSLYIAAVCVLLVFGVYGPEFDAGQFIYFQF